MNWRRNPKLVIGLGAALLVSLGIIVFLLYNRSQEQYQEPVRKIEPPRHAPPPPPQEVETKVMGNKPALVLFYADWCGHSKTMMPVWQQLKDMLSQSGGIDVLDLEHGRNAEEIKSHGVRGFPELRLYPTGFPSDNFIPYGGDRSMESLMKFVQSGGKDM